MEKRTQCCRDVTFASLSIDSVNPNQIFSMLFFGYQPIDSTDFVEAKDPE